MKKSNKILILILLISIVSLSIYIYDGYTKAPYRIRYNYRYIESEKIHPDLDGLQIAFFSDLYYKAFVDNDQLDYIIDKVNNVNADIVIFLGDLIYTDLSDDEYAYLLNKLNSINAKYGKFAVLGEADYQSDSINEMVENILYNSNFEIIKNQSFNISKDSKQSIQLVGIDSPLDYHDDIVEAYKNVDSKKFTLTIMHTPDTVKDLPLGKTDLAIAGHSFGGKIKIPLLGQIYNKELAEDYYSGLYSLSSLKLYVSHGTGLTDEIVRINAPAEIVIYTLKNKWLISLVFLVIFKLFYSHL